MTTLALAEAVRYRYPGADRDALAGVSLAVESGRVLVLAGPSGGGKSTLLRALAGLVPHFHGGRFAGRVLLDGLDTRRAPGAELARRVALAFQDPEAQGVYNRVDRDVAFGLENLGHPRAEIERRTLETLERVGAAHLATRTLESLSGGERQRVALAGVLAPRPPLLLLDEPTAQLDDDGAALLAALLRRLADEGLGVVAAEHRVDRLAAVADEVLLVDEGRLGTFVPTEPGPTTPVDAAAAVPEDETPALSTSGLDLDVAGRPVLRGVDVAVPRGRVTAVLGPNGAGKTTLLRALAGLDRPRRGTIRLAGVDVTALPAERRYPRVALVVQDPGRHLLAERVDEEVAFGLASLALGEGERRRLVDAALATFDLAPLAARHPRDLSAGQRERLALAAALAADPAVLLLDEPTRGMDLPRRAALAALLVERAGHGRSAVVVTHDRAFARAAAHDLLELRDGRLGPLRQSAEVAA